MTDPLALLPLALAAAGGRVGPHSVAALVAAGHTLLQRSAVLVRALSGRRAALLLPPGAAAITALAASDGHGALLLPVTLSPSVLRARLAEHAVGALFTIRAAGRVLAETALPPDLVVAHLDEVPTRATVTRHGQSRVVDLGSHFGLDLAGDPTTPGLDEPCVWIEEAWYSHEAVLRGARLLAAASDRDRTGSVATDWSLASFLSQCAVLLGGGTLADGSASDGDHEPS